MASGVAQAVSSGRPSLGKGVVTGATSGASLGSVAGPWGAAAGGFLGGVVGGITGAAGASQAEQDYQAKQSLIARMNRDEIANLARDPNFLRGNQDAGFYKYGGHMGETDPKNLEQIADGSFAVNGPSHEQGGVAVGPNTLEGGETISNGYVFSKELGFAKAHKPIAKAIGRLEEKSPSPLRNKTLKSLKDREIELAKAQEMVKLNLGV